MSIGAARRTASIPVRRVHRWARPQGVGDEGIHLIVLCGQCEVDEARTIRSLCGNRSRESRLADACRADECHQAIDGDQFTDGGHVPGSTDERCAPHRQQRRQTGACVRDRALAWPHRRRGQRRVLVEHAPVERLQIWRRLDPERLDQDRADRVVAAECVSLTAVSILRRDQHAPQPFPQRMFPCESCEIADQLGALACIETALTTELGQREAQLLEPAPSSARSDVGEASMKGSPRHDASASRSSSAARPSSVSSSGRLAERLDDADVDLSGRRLRGGSHRGTSRRGRALRARVGGARCGSARRGAPDSGTAPFQTCSSSQSADSTCPG